MSVALKKAANAVSGKTARACDSCLGRRARWYCAADDAFLCQPCDSSVHSANPLARRHDRVRLKTSSSSSIADRPAPAHTDLSNDSTPPAWHRGLKRKARTPRHGKNSAMLKPRAPLVPDLDAAALADDNGEQEEEEEEEQLLYQVPVFDPVLAEFCSPPLFDEANSQQEEKAPLMTQSHGLAAAGFGPSDAELAEFAADVENLLGQGLDDDDNFCIDGLGLLDANEYDHRNQVIKMELTTTETRINGASNGNFLVDMESEFSRESLEFNFDCGSAGEEAEEQKVEVGQKGIGLRLDCEAVIAAWSCRGSSPWTDGERPQFNLDDCWPDFTDMWGSTGGGEVQRAYGDVGIGGQAVHGNGDSGREARVSRYREKRRSRLFSKKIRYEVRKLNAEKRPRMKGRFVKRGSNPAAVAVAVADGTAMFPYV